MGAIAVFAVVPGAGIIDIDIVSGVLKLQQTWRDESVGRIAEYTFAIVIFKPFLTMSNDFRLRVITILTPKL